LISLLTAGHRGCDRAVCARAPAAAMMRLRLRCGAAYSLGDLQWCMLHVPDHVHLIRDLAGHISRLLELNLRGGNGELPQLLLDGFLIPHSEDVRQVLRDDEVVDVEPREPGGGGVDLAAHSTPAKRPAPSPSGASKRQRQEPAPPVAAIGWQPPAEAPAPAAEGRAARAKASVPAPKVKPTRPETSSSEEEESSEEGSEEQGGAAVASSAAVARSRGQARGGCFGGGRGRGQEEQAAASSQAGKGRAANAARDDGRGIFVGGLPPNLDSAGLKKHFQYYGAVEEAEVVMNQSTGKSKGFGFVEFADARSRDKVIADGPTQEISGKRVEVKPRTPKGGKGHKGKEPAPKGEGKQGRGHKGKDAAGDQPALRQAKAALPAPMPLNDEEAEMQRQMAALGLPVSFTASAGRAGESDEEEEEEGSAEDE